MDQSERKRMLRSLVLGLCDEILYCTRGEEGPEADVHDDIAEFVAEISRDEIAALDFILKVGKDGERWNSEVLPQNEAIIPLLYALELLLRKYKALALYGVEKNTPQLRWFR